MQVSPSSDVSSCWSFLFVFVLGANATTCDMAIVLLSVVTPAREMLSNDCSWIRGRIRPQAC